MIGLARALAAGLAFLSLAGCASLGPQAPAQETAVLPGKPDRFSLEGRIALRAGEQPYSGGLHWQHALESDRLLFTTPLGQGAAELNRAGEAVWLVDAGGRRFEGEVAASWLHDHLGMSFPLAEMGYWVVGRPHPQAAHVLRLDEMGRVAGLDQSGWRLEYDRYRSEGGVWLPGRIFARYGTALDMRLVVNRWQIP